MWKYKGSPVSEPPIGYCGFVYLITNKVNDRKYIGKKIFNNKKKLKPLKNQKRRRITYKDSGWADYWGSSDELLSDISKYGPENFEREVLWFCVSKSQMTYLEAKEQFSREVLESDKYYNNWIACKIRKSNIRKLDD
jgi:hypothetical protein